MPFALSEGGELTRPGPRTIQKIVSRRKAGESVVLLAEEFGISEELARTCGNDYGHRHKRVAKARGPARDHDCVRCLENGVAKKASTWATVHGCDGSDPWADYVPLCQQCHFAYDNVHEIRKSNGWEEKNLSGQRHRRSLSDQKVREVREALGEGFGTYQIAQVVGVRAEIIRGIRDGRLYRDVK